MGFLETFRVYRHNEVIVTELISDRNRDNSMHVGICFYCNEVNRLRRTIKKILLKVTLNDIQIVCDYSIRFSYVVYWYVYNIVWICFDLVHSIQITITVFHSNDYRRPRIYKFLMPSLSKPQLKLYRHYIMWGVLEIWKQLLYKR